MKSNVAESLSKVLFFIVIIGIVLYQCNREDGNLNSKVETIIEQADNSFGNGNYIDALKMYKDALDNISYRGNRELYAYIKYKQGETYMKLSDIKNKQVNLKKSIEAINIALEVYNKKDYPKEYGLCYQILGYDYNNLKSEDFKENKKYRLKAIELFKKALSVNVDIFDAVVCLTGIGYAYQELSYIDEPKENLYRASLYYQETLNILDENKNSAVYAITQMDLGYVYYNYARASNSIVVKKEYVYKAIELYKEAFDILTIDEYPVEYARVKNNIGVAYKILSRIEDKKNNILKAIESLEQALTIYNIDNYPELYAKTCLPLADAYKQLSGIQNKQKNIEKSRLLYKEALKVYNKKDYPEEYEQLILNIKETEKNEE